jgi:hypothetical protein
LQTLFTRIEGGKKTSATVRYLLISIICILERINDNFRTSQVDP